MLDNNQKQNKFKDFLLPKEIPLRETSWNERISIAKEIYLAALSTIFSTVGCILKDVISLYFIGHLDNPLLFAAAGFGMTWINALGSAVIEGFTGGFGTLASQAFGAKNYYKFGLLYQKTLAAMTGVMLLICTFLWFTRTELIALGFDEELATEAGHFIRYLVLDLFFFMVFETTKYYLLAQNLFQIPAYILLITTVIHIFWCYLFVNALDLGLIGVAIARTITDATSALLIFLYIKVKNPCPESWFPWVKECLQGLVSYAKTIGSHGSALYFEWIAFELTTIIIGYMGDIPVIAAYSATQNYLLANASMSIGLTISTSIFVGNAAGEGSLYKAQKYAYIGFISNIVLITLLDLFILCFKNEIASFYTNEINVKELIMTMLTIYFFGMHADLMNNALCFLLRTLGQERFVLKRFLWCYDGIGVGFSVIFGVWLGFGFYGVWGSLLMAFFVMFTLVSLRFKNLDWEYEVKKIANEMKRTSTSGEIECDLEMRLLTP